MIYFFFSPAEVSESTQYIARQLMLAQEIRKLPDHKALILIQGEEAIYADKIPWYKNKYLTSLQQGKITITSIMPIVQNIFKRASLISERDMSRIMCMLLKFFYFARGSRPYCVAKSCLSG